MTQAAHWRGSALEWLRADLVLRREQIATAPGDVAKAMAHWKQDRDLAGVRDRIDELPEAEREGWRKLWAEVDALLARAKEAQR